MLIFHGTLLSPICAYFLLDLALSPCEGHVNLIYHHQSQHDLGQKLDPVLPLFDIALTLPWTYLGIVLALPRPCLGLDLTLTLPLNFSSTRVSNSWDISDMDKCHKDKCWLNKYYNNGWHLSKMVRLKFGQQRVSNSGYIPDMDKCPQDKCCLDQCQIDSWNLL